MNRRSSLVVPHWDMKRSWSEWLTLWFRIGEVDAPLLERHGSATAVPAPSPPLLRRRSAIQRATALPHAFESLAAAAARATAAQERYQPRICGLRLRFGRRATLLLTLMLIALAIDVAGLLPALTFPLWVWGMGAAVASGGWQINSVVTIIEGAVTTFWHLAIMWMLFGDFARIRLLLLIDSGMVLALFVSFRAACEVLYAGQTPTGLRIIGNIISLAVQVVNSVVLARYFASLGPESEFAEMFMFDDSGDFGVSLTRASSVRLSRKQQQKQVEAAVTGVEKQACVDAARDDHARVMSTRASQPSVQLSHVLLSAKSDRRVAWPHPAPQLLGDSGAATTSVATRDNDSPTAYVLNPIPLATSLRNDDECGDVSDGKDTSPATEDVLISPLAAHWLDLDTFCCCCACTCIAASKVHSSPSLTAGSSSAASELSTATRAPPPTGARVFPSTWRIVAILMLPFISAIITAWLFIFVIVPILFTSSSSAVLRVLATAIATPLWFTANRAFLRVASIQLLHGNQSATWVGLYLLGAQSILLTRLFNAANDTLADQVRSTAAVVGVQLLGRLTVKLQHAMAAQVGRLQSPFTVDMLSFRLPSRSLWVLAQSIVLIQMVQFSMVGVMNFTAFYVKATRLGVPVSEAVSNGVALSVIQVALDIPACIIAMMFEEWCGIPVVQAFRERWRTLLVVVFVNGAFITWFGREYLPGLVLLVLGRAETVA